jgi:hypothetical protein
VSLSLGWEREPTVDNAPVISNAISSALAHRDQKVLVFAAASNMGGSKHELFPAKHPTVFSVRGANTKGKHEDFNPSLPKHGENVFATLGVQVPARNLGDSKPLYSPKSGTSVATAIMAGLAAIIVGYINIHGTNGSWDSIRTFQGFQSLLYKLSTEPEERKRFVTLDNHSREDHRAILEAVLNIVSDPKEWR